MAVVESDFHRDAVPAEGVVDRRRGIGILQMSMARARPGKPDDLAVVEIVAHPSFRIASWTPASRASTSVSSL